MSFTENMGESWETEPDEDWRETWLGKEWAANPDMLLWRRGIDMVFIATIELEANPQTGKSANTASMTIGSLKQMRHLKNLS